VRTGAVPTGLAPLSHFYPALTCRLSHPAPCGARIRQGLLHRFTQARSHAHLKRWAALRLRSGHGFGCTYGARFPLLAENARNGARDARLHGEKSKSPPPFGKLRAGPGQAQGRLRASSGQALSQKPRHRRGTRSLKRVYNDELCRARGEPGEIRVCLVGGGLDVVAVAAWRRGFGGGG
jgi:hypothetical protein